MLFDSVTSMYDSSLVVIEGEGWKERRRRGETSEALIHCFVDTFVRAHNPPDVTSVDGVNGGEAHGFPKHTREVRSGWYNLPNAASGYRSACRHDPKWKD